VYQHDKKSVEGNSFTLGDCETFDWIHDSSEIHAALVRVECMK
jgi:hypothetical protein